MVPGANRQVNRTLHEVLDPFIKIDQLPGHPLLALEIEQVASNAHKIIFCSHLPQPLKPRNMKMKIGG
jgi:hypothetical protein